MNHPAKKPSWGEMLLQHVIVFLICVVFPGVVTGMVPATWISFERSADGVRATTRTCLFFVVPYRVQQVAQVTGFSQRERLGRTEKVSKLGRTTGKTVEVQGEGFLQIQGAGDKPIEVSVSPASLESVIAKSNAFLSSTSPSSMTLFTIANWKFGGLMGGFLTLFTLLYVVGYTLGFLKWIVTLITGFSSISSHRER